MTLRRLSGRLPKLLVLPLLLLLTACQDATPRLPPLPPWGVILAFGDSLTFGTGAPPSGSYPAQLQRMTGREVINGGVPGETSGEGLKRLPQWLDRHRPQLLILCHGGNDILRRMDLAQTAANLREMVVLARERDVPVVLVGVPRPGFFLSSAEFYGELAEELGVPYEGESVTEILGERELKSDAIHPNAEGYERLAKSLEELLSQAGAI